MFPSLSNCPSQIYATWFSVIVSRQFSLAEISRIDYSTIYVDCHAKNDLIRQRRAFFTYLPFHFYMSSWMVRKHNYCQKKKYLDTVRYTRIGDQCLAIFSSNSSRSFSLYLLTPSVFARVLALRISGPQSCVCTSHVNEIRATTWSTARQTELATEHAHTNSGGSRRFLRECA